MKKKKKERKKEKANFLLQSIRITENYHLEFLLSGEAASFIHHTI